MASGHVRGQPDTCIAPATPPCERLLDAGVFFRVEYAGIASGALRDHTRGTDAETNTNSVRSRTDLAFEPLLIVQAQNVTKKPLADIRALDAWLECVRNINLEAASPPGHAALAGRGRREEKKSSGPEE